MFEQANGLPEQIGEALGAKLPPLPASKRVCICGMGASALAGEVVSDFSDDTGGLPITVVRGIELPRWVDRDTAAIFVSYSGDTKEVLIAYDEARRRGCRIICLTAGGNLKQKCVQHKNALVKVPTGLQSRGAFGYLLGYLSKILEEMKVCKAATALGEMLPELKRHRDDLISENNDLVEKIAEALLDKIPVIYSLENMRASAIRWKTQINENSKIISFCGFFPEFNHNEIMGWMHDDKNDVFIPVILYDDNAAKEIKEMANTSVGMLDDKKLKTISYRVTGTSNLEKNLKCIMLGDFVSLRLARLRNTDPAADTPVEDVDSMIVLGATQKEP